VRNSSGRRPAKARNLRGSGSSLEVVLATALLALLIATVAAAVSGVHPTARQAAATARAASGAVARAAASVSGAGAPISSSWLSAHPEADLDVHGQADIVIDVDARQVLWQRDPHTPRAPASLTRLVTAMVAADLAPLDRRVTVTAATDVGAVRKVEPTSTVMGLDAGEVLTVRELLYGLFLRSGNDAAETLGGGIVARDQFVQLMNQKAASLHMADSHFTTPVGLDDPGMRTSPYDLAVAAATITTRYPALLAISGTPSIKLAETGTHKAFDMTNYNKLLLPGNQYAYQGATGMKTAFTDDAGPCMVATATRGGRHLVAVVMNSDNFFADATRLLDYGFAQPVRPSPKPTASPKRG
jgi:D-alanyl-D-alanine carboxypeptidase (penicillin-binding protein 5/6)